MKNLLFIFFGLLLVSLFTLNVNAQMMGARLPDGQGFSNSSADRDQIVDHTFREEKEGKELWSKFQAKEIACVEITDEQFGVLGEYFMGQMMEDSHAAMNAMMMQMHGEEGEEQIHIVMGKRLSGCDTSASLPMGSGGWMPMMNMMWGGMNFGFTPFGAFGWIFMILWWVFIIAGIVALIKWLAGQSRGGASGKSALDILQKRYAKGEIDKKEFEERKKDLI